MDASKKLKKRDTKKVQRKKLEMEYYAASEQKIIQNVPQSIIQRSQTNKINRLKHKKTEQTRVLP